MNKFILIALRVKNSNPNGDPNNSNKPRQLDDGTGYVTDVCVKSHIRQILKNKHNKEIFCDNFSGKSPEKISEEKNKKANGTKMSDIVEKYIDTKLFGAVIPGKGKRVEESSRRGPVQITPLVSTKPIEIHTSATNPMPAEQHRTNGIYYGKIFINDENDNYKINEEEYSLLINSLKEIFAYNKSGARPDCEISDIVEFDLSATGSCRTSWADKIKPNDDGKFEINEQDLKKDVIFKRIELDN